MAIAKDMWIYLSWIMAIQGVYIPNTPHRNRALRRGGLLTKCLSFINFIKALLNTLVSGIRGTSAVALNNHYGLAYVWVTDCMSIVHKTWSTSTYSICWKINHKTQSTSTYILHLLENRSPKKVCLYIHNSSICWNGAASLNIFFHLKIRFLNTPHEHRCS